MNYHINSSFEVIPVFIAKTRDIYNRLARLSWPTTIVTRVKLLIAIQYSRLVTRREITETSLHLDVNMVMSYFNNELIIV